MTATLPQKVWQLTNGLGVRVSKNLLRLRLEQHPNYPSALSITDTLQGLGIENLALQLERESLSEVPLPFLAHLNIRGGDFAVVKDPSLISNTNSSFYKEWTGIVIAAEKPIVFADPENERALQQERKQTYLWTGLLLSLILMAGWAFLQSLSFIHLLLLLTNLAGMGLSVLIVLQEMGVSNQLTQTFCSAGKNTDCNSVIQSSGAKIFGLLGWSDIGVVFFLARSFYY